MKSLHAALLLLPLLAPAGAAEPAQEVDKVVRSTVEQVLAVLKDPALSKEAKKKKVLSVVDPILDWTLMAKLSLGRDHWPKLDAAKQKEFTALFVEQIQTSYFEKIDLFSDEKVEYEAPQAKGNKFDMLTHILSKDERIAMLYKLYKSGAAWKVYDVEIEGVSIVKSYGSQYDEILKTGTPDDLLAKMRQKIKDMKDGAAPKADEAGRKEPKLPAVAPAVAPQPKGAVPSPPQEG